MRPHHALCAPILSALALSTLAPPALAQGQYPQPRGSYERLCTDIRMNGPFLSATCRGARGPAGSSLNTASCASDIGVDAEGGLVCSGPGAAPPPRPGRPPPGGYPPPRPPYGDDGRPGRDTITLFSGKNLRGQAVRVAGPMPNLARTGLNDRVRSIQLDRRSGPWIVCADADYRGRCVTITRSIPDTRELGMARDISSLRPARR